MPSLHCVIKKDSLRNGDNTNGAIWIICRTDGIGGINIKTIRINNIMKRHHLVSLFYVRVVPVSNQLHAFPTGEAAKRWMKWSLSQ